MLVNTGTANTRSQPTADGVHVPHPGSESAASLHTTHQAQSENPADGPDGISSVHDSTSPVPHTGGPFEAAFLICIPGYLSETVSVTLNAPAALFDVLVLLNDARSDESRRRFPHLVETFPQPDTNFGSFVAVPDWDCMVATVLIDARPHSQWHLLHDFASQG